MKIDVYRVFRIAGLIFLVALFLFLKQKDREEIRTLKTLYSASQDSLVFYENNKQELVGRIETLRSQKAQDFLEMKTKDKSILQLQELVKDYEKKLRNLGVAGVIHTEGGIEIQIETVVDTVTATYNSEFNLDGWVWGRISAGKEFTNVFVRYKDSIKFVLGEERTGFLGLGKRVPFSDVISMNPYNEVQTYRTYQVTPATRRRIGIGPVAGTGFVGTEFTPIFVGIGVQYCLICL